MSRFRRRFEPRGDSRPRPWAPSAPAAPSVLSAGLAPCAERRYFRFVVGACDRDSHVLAGVFCGSDQLPPQTILPHVRRRLRREFAWFNEHLPVAKLAQPEPLAIFWFRPRAGEPLRRMRDFATWLRSQGLPVHNVQTDDPGRIVFVDEFQVAAVPTSDRARHAEGTAAGRITVLGGWTS